MRTIGDLPLIPTWASSRHLVSTAIHIMRGHRLKALAVVDEGRLVGLVSLDRAAAAGEREPVAVAMEPVTLALNANMPVNRAARVMVAENLDYAPVMRDDEFVGMLTPNLLLMELGRSYDPLTGLSWSDRLREWGADQLRAGHELTLIFFDVDQFGAFNKRHGHIVGDMVLHVVTQVMKEAVDDKTDVLVRYGGDEFVLATIRDRTHSVVRAEYVSELVAKQAVSGVEEPITVTYGLAGGRRTEPRDEDHIGVTLDSLISLASKDCMRRKREKRLLAEGSEMRLTGPGSPSPEPGPDPGPKA